jgi:hypothetical protein
LLDASGKAVELEPSMAYLFGNWQVGSRVTLGGLKPGAYTAVLWGSTIEPLSLSVAAKENEVTPYVVTLHRGAELVVTLQNPATEISDDVFGQAVVTLTDARGNAVALNNGEGVMAFRQSGRARKMTGLAAGSYTATITVPGYVPAVIPVSLSRGAQEARTFTLTPVVTGG